MFFMLLYASSVLLKAKAEEELQETQSQISSLLSDLSSLKQTDRGGAGPAAVSDFTDAASSPPEDAVALHTDMLHVRTLCWTNVSLNLFSVRFRLTFGSVFAGRASATPGSAGAAPANYTDHSGPAGAARLCRPS